LLGGEGGVAESGGRDIEGYGEDPGLTAVGTCLTAGDGEPISEAEWQLTSDSRDYKGIMTEEMSHLISARKNGLHH
jgi:hypothetical protein